MYVRPIAFACFLIVAPIGSAQMNHDIKAASKAVVKSLQANYDRMSAAFAKNDITVFEEIIAEDYVLTPMKGDAWNRDHVLKDFKRQMGNMQNAQWLRHITSAHMEGGLVVVNVSGTFRGTFAGEGGKKSVFELKSDSIDAWDVSGSSPMLKKSKMVRMVAKVDGKSMG